MIPWIVDAMRTNPATAALLFFRSMQEAGADGVYVVDSRGNSIPTATYLFIQRVREAIGPDCDLYVQHHNDLGVATANAIAAVEAGANWIDCSVNGIGDRGGCVALEEAAPLFEMYGIETGIKLDKLYELCLFVKKVYGIELPPWKPIVGENWNKEEGAGHLEGATGAEATIGINPRVVGREFEAVIGSKILFGRERSSAYTDDPVFLRHLIEEWGIKLTEEQFQRALTRARGRGRDLVRALLSDLRRLPADLRRRDGCGKSEGLIAHPSRWRRLAFGLVPLLALLISSGAVRVPVEAQAAWPSRPVTLVVPFDPGGSLDRLGRGLAQFMPKYLGQPITVVNRPGAGGQVGATWFLQQPDDGYTLLMDSATPYILVNILVTGAKYTLDDFAFINAQWTDFNILAVPKDRAYKTAKELIDAIKAHPGQLSEAVDFGSVGQITTILMLQQLGLKPDAVRQVTLDGGGPVRTAIVGNQVDFSIVEGQGGIGMGNLIRTLAVFLDRRSSLFDAPPINEVLRGYKTSVPILSGSSRILIAPASFKKKHPQDYDRLVAAYRKTLEDKDFQAWLKDNQMGDDWIGPEKTTAMLKTNLEVLAKYKDLIKK